MSWPTDPLAGVFLGLFAFGFLFTIGSLLLGMLGGHGHFPGDGHVDHGGALDHGGVLDHAGHVGHVGHHGGHVGHGGEGAGDHGALGHADGVVGVPAAPGPLNLSTIMIFLTWFGATGYLLRISGAVAAISLLVATAVGIVGAAILWLFLAKFLWRGQTALDPYNYRIEGTIGRLSAPIRAGGTGEVVYVLDGKQVVDGARSSDGTAIPAGSDVVILHFANGLAYVAPTTASLGSDTLTLEPEVAPLPPVASPLAAEEERRELSG